MVAIRGYRLSPPYHEPKGGLVLYQGDDAAKEWGNLGSRALVSSTITYEPKINSRKLQGEKTGARARQDSGTADGDTDIVGESQGGSGHTMNGVAILAGITGQV